jgi:mycofactocin system glycosyltransferase
VADPILDGVDVDAARLTVVIPVLNRPAQLDRTLASLAPLRCIVVDDASTDAASISAVADRHGAQLVRLPSNAGPAAARNAGLRHVHTEYVAFVDSDVQVTAPALLGLTRHFADRQVGLVGPLVRSRSRSTTPRWFERYDERSSSLALGDRACQVAPGAHVGWLPSACLVGRRAAVASGFDSRMRVGEDVDLVWRLVDDQVVVRYDPAVTAVHDARPSIGGWLGRKFIYGTGGAALAQRYGDRTAVAAMPPVMAIAAAALLQRKPWSVLVAALCVTDAGRRLRTSLPNGDGRDRVAALLALRGLGWAVRQEAALLLRHWAPPVLIGCLVSRRLRRAVATALLVDTAIALPHTVRDGGRDVLPDAIARRLDDLAYGAGLWAGLLRAGGMPAAWRCVGIRLVRRQRRTAGPPALPPSKRIESTGIVDYTCERGLSSG